jgi:predicted PilT family ATPase
MEKKNNSESLDNVYFEIHRMGERVVVIPSALMTKDLIENHRKAHDKMDEIKKLISNDPNVHKELKKRLISDLYDIQQLTKFWNEYEK